MDKEKVVVRYLDGKITKGHIVKFSPSDREIIVKNLSNQKGSINMAKLKAISFVRTFEGERGYGETKSFLGTISKGKEVFVKFKDGEAMIGFVEGDTPWQRGFFLESIKNPGFF